MQGVNELGPLLSLTPLLIPMYLVDGPSVPSMLPTFKNMTYCHMNECLNDLS